MKKWKLNYYPFSKLPLKDRTVGERTWSLLSGQPGRSSVGGEVACEGGPVEVQRLDHIKQSQSKGCEMSMTWRARVASFITVNDS